MALIRIWVYSRDWGKRSQTELSITVKSVLVFLVCCDPDKRATAYGHMQVLANLFLIDFSYEMGAAMSSESVWSRLSMSLPWFLLYYCISMVGTSWVQIPWTTN